jgi:hypothetical protein
MAVRRGKKSGKKQVPVDEILNLKIRSHQMLVDRVVINGVGKIRLPKVGSFQLPLTESAVGKRSGQVGDEKSWFQSGWMYCLT